jgi:hypothetical protein
MAKQPTAQCPDGHQNPAGQKFCGQCGSALAGLCPNGHRNAEGQKFCGQCGSRIDATAPFRDASAKPGYSTPGETLWTAGTKERAPREGFAAEKSDAKVPLSLGKIFTRSNLTRAVPWWPVAVIVVALALMLATCEDKPSKTSSGKTSSGRQPSTSATGYAGTLYEDWIPAVCQQGTYFDTSNALLPNAIADASCKSARGNPIMMGQFASEFSAKNAVALFRGAEYAIAAVDTGTGEVVQVFLSPAAPSALAPLRSFGFVINTVPRG